MSFVQPYQLRSVLDRFRTIPAFPSLGNGDEVAHEDLPAAARSNKEHTAAPGYSERHHSQSRKRVQLKVDVEGKLK